MKVREGTVSDADSVLEKLEAHYRPEAQHCDKTDGLSMAFDGWRFNVRKSNTEPLLRINVESRGDQGLMQRQLKALLLALR